MDISHYPDFIDVDLNGGYPKSHKAHIREIICGLKLRGEFRGVTGVGGQGGQEQKFSRSGIVFRGGGSDVMHRITHNTYYV